LHEIDLEENFNLVQEEIKKQLNFNKTKKERLLEQYIFELASP
jgi:hypothetical protein